MSPGLRFMANYNTILQGVPEYFLPKQNLFLDVIFLIYGLIISTTPNTAMGNWQCLHLSVVQLKGKHCRKPHCRNGVVGTFRHVQTLQVLDFLSKALPVQ